MNYIHHQKGFDPGKINEGVLDILNFRENVIKWVIVMTEMKQLDTCPCVVYTR